MKLVLTVEYGLELFYFCIRLCKLSLVFCMVKEFLGIGWICTRRLRLVRNGLEFFIAV